MYAIINDRNKQYLVKKGSILKVDSRLVKKGDVLEFNDIIMFCDNNDVVISDSKLKNMVVKSVVKDYIKDNKVVTLKFKRRKHYMKKIGHRQKYVVLEITYIGNK